MTHKNLEERREYWRLAQQRRRKRLREDAYGTVQRELFASASAGMADNSECTTFWFNADDATVRNDLPEGSDLRAVQRAWVPEIPLVRVHDAMGAALLRRPFSPLFMGFFARRGCLFGSFSEGQA